MNLLDRFSHHIFISYAHADDEDPEWVTEFRQKLRTKLKKLFALDARIWRDENDIRRAAKFDTEIENAISGSAVFLCLLSNSYLGSDYCKKEWKAFQKHAEQGEFGPSANEFHRAIAVRLYNIEFDRWPDVVQGTSGHDFFGPGPTDLGRSLQPESPEFDEAIEKLADEVHALLTGRAWGQSDPDLHDDQADSSLSSVSVFVAAASQDFDAVRSGLIRRLAKSGSTVRSDIPPPESNPEHRVAVTDFVDTADICVHMLGNEPGRAMAGSDPVVTYPMDQLQAVRESGRRQLILLPDEFELDYIENEHADYRQLMENIRNATGDASVIERVQGSRNRMIDEVLARVREIAASRRTPEGREQRPRAFIDVYGDDFDQAKSLSRYLLQKNVEFLLRPSANTTPSQNMEAYADHLRRHNFFLILFGHVDREWVLNRCHKALKIVKANRLSTKICVYLAPPKKSDNDTIFPKVFHVANNMESFDPGSLDPLFS